MSESIFKTWAEKLGKEESEIQEEYKEAYERNRAKQPSDEAAHQYTLMQLRTKYRAELRTSAIWFDMLIIGKSEPNFYMKKRYDNAKAIFEDSKSEAIDAGLTDETGEPLETRATLYNGDPNPNYRRPLKDVDFGKKSDGTRRTYADKAVATVIGLARKKNTDEIKRFTMTLFDESALKDFPILMPSEARANLQEELPEEFKLGMSTATKFTPIKEEIEEFDIGKIWNADYFDKVEIPKLEIWNDENSGDFDAVVMTRGMVSAINMEGPRYNNVFIDEVTTEIGDDFDDDNIAPATMVQVPKSVPIDFAEGSLIVVFGRTWRGYATEDGEGQINITSYSVWAPPEFKVEVEEEVQATAQEKAEKVVNENEEFF